MNDTPLKCICGQFPQLSSSYDIKHFINKFEISCTCGKKVSHIHLPMAVQIWNKLILGEQNEERR